MRRTKQSTGGEENALALCMALPGAVRGIGEHYPEICDSVTGDSSDSRKSTGNCDSVTDDSCDSRKSAENRDSVTVVTVGNRPKTVTV